jgi:hypothetical protein
VAAGKEESDLGFWEREGKKGKARGGGGGGMTAGKGKSDLGFWKVEGKG